MKNDIINVYSHLIGSLFALTYKALPSENKLVLAPAGALHQPSPVASSHEVRQALRQPQR